MLAALLFIVGRLALAMTVELSIGMQFVDVERVRPWAVAKAALGNAAVILGLSTPAQSLYWVWRELTLSGPVLDWVTKPSDAKSSIARVAHLSDLHSLVSATAIAWRPGLTAREVTGAFVAPCASSPR